MASVLVPLAQGCEELEAITVVDLLRRADIGVVTASLDAEPVRGSRGSVLDNIDDIQYSEDAVVQDGKLITSRRPGTAMDFALTLIENLTNREKRDAVEATLQR